MKYIITKFETCDEVLSSYCQLHAKALVFINEEFTTLYIEPNIIIDLDRYKSFCEHTLPYIRNRKPTLKFYKAKVEFPQLQYSEALFGVKAEPWTIRDQIQFESSVRINKYCYLSKQKKGGD